ncbi:MAG: hypothetical protein HYV17_07895 [Xanthomonadales bacterium]|nr:hypothetical protein [Xanthomonadales bacterium]
MARPSHPPATVPAEINADGAKVSRAEQAKLAAFSAEASAVLQNAGITVQYSLAGFVEMGKGAAIDTARAMLVMGSALLAIRANEPASTFRWALEQIGVGERSAYAAMKFARDVGKSAAHRKVYEALGTSKAIAVFGSYSEDDVKDLAYDDEKISEFAGKSVRQLHAEFKKEREEAAQQLAARDKIIQRRQKRIEELERQIDSRPEADPAVEQSRTLMSEFGTAATDAIKALAECERLVSELRAIQQSAGHVMAAATQEQITASVELIAKRVARLQDVSVESKGRRK